MIDLYAIYRDGYRNVKAGVMLVELQANTIRQGELDLFDDATYPEQSVPRDKTKLIVAIYRLDHRYGKGALQLGTNSLVPAASDWSKKSDRRTDAAVHHSLRGDARYAGFASAISNQALIDDHYRSAND